MRQTLGDDHDSTLVAMHCLGYCYQRMCSDEGDEWQEPGNGAASADDHLKDKARHNAQAKELYMECLARRRQVREEKINHCMPRYTPHSNPHSYPTRALTQTSLTLKCTITVS